MIATLRILFVLICMLPTIMLYGQQKGRYRPTKFDSVKKVIPQQVYGKPQPKKVVDSVKEVTSPIEAPIKTNLSQEELEKRLIKKSKSDAAPKQEVKPKSKPLPKPKPPVKKEIEIQSSEPDEPLIQEAEPEKVRESYLTKAWTLEECIAYARKNNLQVAESELNERLAKLVYQQSKSSRLPNLNADASLGDSYGRSIDPTSNQFVTKGFLYNSLGLSSQVLVFGWFQKQHQIEQNQLEINAANAAYNQLKDDISLNVATGYLRVLLAREQVKINESQVKLDKAQYEQTLKFANAGKLPELNVYQMKAQLSGDSASLVSARADERIALLQLRALMNFDLNQAFDIETPNTDLSELSAQILLTNPEDVYGTSLKNQYRMRYNELKLRSAKKSLDLAKSVQYPQLSIFANLGTSYSSNVKDITGQTYVGEVPLGYLNFNGSSYPITRPDYTYSTRTRTLFNQYGDNIRANAGISLNIPIFNAYTARTNIQKAKIGLVSQQIAMDNDKQKLKQDIYKAYEEARAANQKYQAAKRSEDASKRALDFAIKRYEVGMINTYEYTSTLNSLYNASSSVLSAKYDLIFKLKVLDYYMGNSLKLD
ncbi:MAG: TolC family protein [Chitinophagaceae bacterium]|nr:TolC family protein [Chitinophagaceae bacterium]